MRTLRTALIGLLSALALSAWAQTVTITNPTNNRIYTDTTAISISASTTGTGISKVDFYQGTTLIGSDSTSPYSIIWTGFALGSYTLTAQAKDSAGTVLATSSPVAVLVNAAPTVSLTSPTANQVFATGSNIVLNATAADSDGSVSKVDFYKNSLLFGTVTSAPYTVTWNNATAGSHSVWAKATDNRGATKTSYSVTFSVAAPPTVSLGSPAANQYYPAPADVTLTATASPGSGGTLAKVEFYQGSTLIGTTTAAPYSLVWRNVPAAAGSYLLTAKATDTRGLSTTSAVIPIVVNASPTVAITSPTHNQVMSAPAEVTLTATAGDADGSIAKVDFFQGTTLVGTATGAPYSFVWHQVPAGTYTLTAQATDNRGIVTTSAPVSLVVNPAGAAQGMFFIHPDHLGTPRLITDGAGQTVWRWDNDEPFGDNLANENPAGLGTFPFNLRLPGQYFDAESGTHYNYFRDYDPATGRYVESDPIGLEGGINTYLYGNANPLRYSDPRGLIAGIDDLVIIGTGLLAGAAMSTPAGQKALGGALSGALNAVREACPCINYTNVYEPNDGKHGAGIRPGPRGAISPEPSNGAATLATSVPAGNARLGHDPATGQLVIFRNHRTDEQNCIKYWHGYVVGQKDLTPDQWRAGRNAGFPDWPRKPQ